MRPGRQARERRSSRPSFRSDRRRFDEARARSPGAALISSKPWTVPPSFNEARAPSPGATSWSRSSWGSTGCFNETRA